MFEFKKVSEDCNHTEPFSEPVFFLAKPGIKQIASITTQTRPVERFHYSKVPEPNNCSQLIVMQVEDIVEGKPSLKWKTAYMKCLLNQVY